MVRVFLIVMQELTSLCNNIGPSFLILCTEGFYHILSLRFNTKFIKILSNFIIVYISTKLTYIFTPIKTKIIKIHLFHFKVLFCLDSPPCTLLLSGQHKD